MPSAAPLGLAHAVHEIELIQETGRHRHGPVDRNRYLSTTLRCGC
jgi:hypothetical protein